MNQAEWQARKTALASAILAVEVEWREFRTGGNWDRARASQDRFHELRRELDEHTAREPATNAGGRDPNELSSEEWRTQDNWLSHEIDFAEIEWKALRADGDWTSAGVAQDRFHDLRRRQAVHAGRRPPAPKSDKPPD